MPSGLVARNLVMALSGLVPASSSILELPIWKKNRVYALAGHVFRFVGLLAQQAGVQVGSGG